MLDVEAKSAERTPGKRTGPSLKKGQDWVPKYATVADILATYEAPDDDTPTIPPEEIAAVVAELEAGADVEF